MTLTIFIRACGKHISTCTIDGENIIASFSALQSNEHYAAQLTDYINNVHDKLDERLLDNMDQLATENIYRDVMYDIANQMRYTINIDD